MLKKSSSYQYIKIPSGQRTLFCGYSQKLFCLQANPLILTWVLRMLYQKDVLYYSKRKKRLTELFFRWFPTKHQYKLNLKILVRFIKHKLHLIDPDNMIDLPVYGQICVPVHMGYKIFDFRREVVVKVFENNVSTSYMRHQIEQVKNASEFDFAPSLRRWSIGERWYEEDYFSGLIDQHKTRDSEELLNKFSLELTPLIESIIFFKSPKLRKSVDHLTEITGYFEAAVSSSRNLRPENAKRIKNFFYSITEQIKAEGNRAIYLVLTHGDFCPANILNTKYGVKILDWESFSLRSALFDFYSFFFFDRFIKCFPWIR